MQFTSNLLNLFKQPVTFQLKHTCLIHYSFSNKTSSNDVLF